MLLRSVWVVDLMIVMCYRPLHVLNEFFKVRLVYYDRRKAYLLQTMTEDWEKLDNKVTYCSLSLSLSLFTYLFTYLSMYL